MLSPRVKIAAVIAAGGAGTRVGSAIPKQFLMLAGKPILLHAVERIEALEGVVQITVALPSRYIEPAREILRSKPWKIPVTCIRGGSTRQESVRRGVATAAKDAQLILVHDAVRPLCDTETMRRVAEAAMAKGSAIPGIAATDTIQRVSRKGRILATAPREELFAIQTPQCFHAEILRSSLEKARRAGFAGTDESSVVRWAGHPVFMVTGSPDNIKITRPLDLKIAEHLMSGMQNENPSLKRGTENRSMFRIGQGIDYHRMIEGRRLILGGVEIPFEKGLQGHSDADVLLHAVCDAILGAAALGDIGTHFPDSDDANLNRSSIEFLRETRTKAESAGWRVCNVDATLLAQRPRLAPFMREMKQNIAEALGISAADVSIKATTTEGMNAEGRGEGISAQAVALLAKLKNAPPSRRGPRGI
jgi:2-C-methyl-D-erythritol 4-phosphate cytidylyltransferase/2-C-methyl-D-erythritol 2,4-cyclodiphosphate synthase